MALYWAQHHITSNTTPNYLSVAQFFPAMDVPPPPPYPSTPLYLSGNDHCHTSTVFSTPHRFPQSDQRSCAHNHSTPRSSSDLLSSNHQPPTSSLTVSPLLRNEETQEGSADYLDYHPDSAAVVGVHLLASSSFCVEWGAEVLSEDEVAIYVSRPQMEGQGLQRYVEGESWVGVLTGPSFILLGLGPQDLNRFTKNGASISPGIQKKPSMSELVVFALCLSCNYIVIIH